jgi:hypothetical protein
MTLADTADPLVERRDHSLDGPSAHEALERGLAPRPNGITPGFPAR